MRVLIFGTCYVNDPEKLRLLHQWVKLHASINPEVDLLLIDSCSPLLWAGDGGPIPESMPKHPRLRLWSFLDDVGHLSRGGQDGWGRAFCYGLQHAIDRGYDYVVHIEGDSLLRKPVLPVCVDMAFRDQLACSVPVIGTKHMESRWVETGLVFFDVRKLEQYDIIEEYNWQDGASKLYPKTPEAKLHSILGLALKMLLWKAVRDDMKVITSETVHEYDWITHTTPEVYDAFVAHALQRVSA